MKGMLVKPVAYTLALLFPAIASTGCSKGPSNDAANMLINADSNQDGVLSKTEAANDMIKRHFRPGDKTVGLTLKALDKIEMEITNAQGVVPGHTKVYSEVLQLFKQIYSENLNSESTK